MKLHEIIPLGENQRIATIDFALTNKSLQHKLAQQFGNTWKFFRVPSIATKLFPKAVKLVDQWATAGKAGQIRFVAKRNEKREKDFYDELSNRLVATGKYKQSKRRDVLWHGTSFREWFLVRVKR